jgi:hypothetical protein
MSGAKIARPSRGLTVHTSSLRRMEWFIRNFMPKKEPANVLDVGSYNVNGCYRELFESRGYGYMGLDMESGPNVDIVASKPYQWQEIEDDRFEAVVSGQALEHIEFFWVTVAEMVRVTKEGGLICIIAPNGFGEHRYPVDCWRFFTDGMVALARYYDLEIINAHTNAAPTADDKDWYSDDCADSMLIARKRYSGKARTVDLEKYACTPGDQEAMRGGLIPYTVAHTESDAHEPGTSKEDGQKEIGREAQINARSGRLEGLARRLARKWGNRRDSREA